MSSESAPQSHKKWTTEEFFRKLREEVPELAPIYGEHILYHDELFPHVLMADYFRFIEQTILKSNDDNLLGDKIVKILQVIEEGLVFGDDDVDNVIGVSFLEDIMYEKDGKIYQVLVPELGEQTLKELRKMEKWYSLRSRIGRWFGRLASGNKSM